MKKQIRALALAVLFALSLLPAAGFAANELPAASAGRITLTEDVTLDTAVNLADCTIDLAQHTLYINVENSYFSNVVIENGNIVLGKDDVHVCDGYMHAMTGTTLTLNNVKITSDASGMKAYAVFHLRANATLNLNDCVVEVAENEYGGSIVYAGDATSVLNIKNSEISGYNVGDGITHATTLLENSEFTITGTDNVEHGINRSALTVVDSKITVTGGTGRGITVQNGAVSFSGNSVVNISGMAEGGFMFKGNKDVTVGAGCSVAVGSVVLHGVADAAITVEEGGEMVAATIPAGVAVKDETGAAIEPAQDGTYGTYVAPAAPAYAGPVMNWVKVNAANNGVVKSGPLAASAGATVTLYPKAAEGYVLDTVEVLDAEGNTVELDGLKFAIPAGGVTVNATFKLAQ